MRVLSVIVRQRSVGRILIGFVAGSCVVSVTVSTFRLILRDVRGILEIFWIVQIKNEFTGTFDQLKILSTSVSKFSRALLQMPWTEPANVHHLTFGTLQARC